MAPLVSVLLILLFLLALGEGGGLFYLWRYHEKLWPPPAPMTGAAMPKRTDRELFYGQPTLLLSKWVREAPLVIDSTDHPIVLSQEGNLLQVDPKTRTAKSLVNQTKVPPPPRGRDEDPKTDLSSSVSIALDASGNRYQIDPAAKVIDKYSPEGTRKMPDIGKGLLDAPTALAVDSQGNLYVIDAHHLKRIEAGEKSETPKSHPATHP